MLTQAELKSQLHYEQETGLFTRLVSNNNGKTKIGDLANSLTERGYIRIRVMAKSYMAHRLAWLYMTGEWASDDIDHKDLNKSNNKWDNLRHATRKQNSKNTQLRSSNRSGFKGVFWHTQTQRWRATDRTNGIKVYLGSFLSAKEASIAYVSYAKKAHKEFYCEPILTSI